MASSKVFAYIDKGYKLSDELKHNYRNSLIFIGDEGQIYSPVNDTYIGIGHTAYTNTISYIENAYAYVIDQVGAALNAIISNSVQHNVNRFNELEKEITLYSTTYTADMHTHVGETKGNDIVFANPALPKYTERFEDYERNYNAIATANAEGGSGYFNNGIEFTSYTLWLSTASDTGILLSGFSEPPTAITADVNISTSENNPTSIAKLKSNLEAYNNTNKDSPITKIYAVIQVAAEKSTELTTIDDSRCILGDTKIHKLYVQSTPDLSKISLVGHSKGADADIINAVGSTKNDDETWYRNVTGEDANTSLNPSKDIVVRLDSAYYQNNADALTRNYLFIGSYVQADDSKTVDYVKKSLAYSMTFTKFWTDNTSNNMYSALLGMEYIPRKLDDLDTVNQLDDNVHFYVYQKATIKKEEATGKEVTTPGKYLPVVKDGEKWYIANYTTNPTTGEIETIDWDNHTDTEVTATDEETLWNAAEEKNYKTTKYAVYADNKNNLIIYTYNDASSKLMSNTDIFDGIQTIKEVSYILDVITNGEDGGISLAYTIAGNHSDIRKLTDETNSIWNGGTVNIDDNGALTEGKLNVNSLSYTNSQYIWLEVTGNGNSTHYKLLSDANAEALFKDTTIEAKNGNFVLYKYNTVTSDFEEYNSDSDTKTKVAVPSDRTVATSGEKVSSIYTSFADEISAVNNEIAPGEHLYVKSQAVNNTYTGDVSITPHLNILTTADIKTSTKIATSVEQYNAAYPTAKLVDDPEGAEGAKTAAEKFEELTNEQKTYNLGVNATSQDFKLNGRPAVEKIDVTKIVCNEDGGLVDDTVLNTYMANSYSLLFNTIKAVQLNSMTYTVETLNNYDYDSRYTYYRNVSGDDTNKTGTVTINTTGNVWNELYNAQNDSSGFKDESKTSSKYIKLVQQTNGYVSALYGVFQTSTHHYSVTADTTTIKGIDRNGKETDDYNNTTYTTLDATNGSTYNYAQLHVEGDVINLSTYTYAVESVMSYGFLADALAVKSYIMDVLSWVDITNESKVAKDTKLDAAWRPFLGATTTNYTYTYVTGVGETFLYKGSNTATNASQYTTAQYVNTAEDIDSTDTNKKNAALAKDSAKLMIYTVKTDGTNPVYTPGTNLTQDYTKDEHQTKLN